MVSRAMVFIVCAASVTMLASQQPAQEEAVKSRFPSGPGRDALLKVCNDCHGAESAVASFKTHEEWSKTLDEMANNGAQATDDEWTLIQAYLDKNYSFIFVNKADAADLATTLDQPTSAAEAIVKRRADRGAFKTIDDLKSVPGVSGAALDARKDRLIF